jgi:hypothetical protein
MPDHFTAADIEGLKQRAAARRGLHYPGTDQHLHIALDHYAITGMDVAVMGSVGPWFEALCLQRGAHPTTIEYNEVDYPHPDITTMTVRQFHDNPRKFDAALSISSFEHDGLGRYGDPLNPTGDLRAMREMRGIVVPGGLMFLAVPVGSDELVWNMHRVYGTLRLPHLLRGWTQLKIYGCYKPAPPAPGSDARQPIFVLRND